MTERATAQAWPLLVVGSLNMDLVFRVPRAPEPGETLTGRDFRRVPGGKGANQAVACARLGLRVAQIGRVGADTDGEQLLAGLRADGIDVRHVTVDASTATGVAMILVDDAAQNRIVLAPGANATLEETHLSAAADLIAQASLMVLQLEVPLATVRAAIALARRAGCRVLLNPAPAQALPDDLWPAIDYLVLNESEIAAFTDLPVSDATSAAAAARQLQERGVGHVLVTLGSAGVLIASPQGVRHQAAHPVQAVDTTAAGDTFIGGLAAGLLEGMTLDDAVGLGQRAAAVCVGRAGAQTSIPRRAELQAQPPLQPTLPGSRAP